MLLDICIRGFGGRMKGENWNIRTRNTREIDMGHIIDKWSMEYGCVALSEAIVNQTQSST